MGIKDIVENLDDFVSWILRKGFGDEADDDDKEAVARAAIEAAQQKVQERARLKLDNEKALQELPERIQAMYQETRKVLDAFKAKPMSPLGLDIKIAATLSQETWDLLRGRPEIGPPSMEIPACVGDFEGTPLVLGDADRNIPERLHALITGDTETPTV